MKWYPTLYTEEEGGSLQVWSYGAVEMEALLGQERVRGKRGDRIVLEVISVHTDQRLSVNVHAFIDLASGYNKPCNIENRWDAVNGWTHWKGHEIKDKRRA